MGALIWTVIFLFAAESSRATSQDNLPNKLFPSFDSMQIEAFKEFLQKSLSPDGTYNRYLLISTGILPAPKNYVTPRANIEEIYTENPLFDSYERFKHYVEEILASSEKTNDAINKLFSAGALKNEGGVSGTTSSSLSSDPTSTRNLQDSSDMAQSDWLINYFADVDIISLDPDQQMAIKNTQYEVEQSSSDSETLSDSNSIEATSTASPEEVSITTEYIKFLTDEQTVSSNTNSDSEGEITQKEQCTTEMVFVENDLSDISPITEYVQFLKTSSNPMNSETEVTESVEYYTTNSDFLTDSSMTVVKESSSNNLEDAFVSVDTLDDYVSLKLFPTTEDRISTSPNEDFTYTLQSKNFEDVTENQRIEFSTDDSEANFKQASQIEFEEAKSQSMRVAKEIRQNESEEESSSRVHWIRGTPGKEFPNYRDIPDNEFNCKDKMHIPGFYADMDTKCQVFHVCWPGRRESFLCPLGTTFNQAILACDYWYNSNCSVSAAYYDVNTAFKEVDTTKSGMTGPMIDTLIKDSKKTEVVPDEIISSSGEISELYEADVHFSETVAKHELSKIWKFLPVKAKIFIQPQLELEDIIGKTKLKRSKKGIADEIDDSNDSRDNVSKVQSKENIESVFFEVLKNLIQSSQEN